MGADYNAVQGGRIKHEIIHLNKKAQIQLLNQVFTQTFTFLKQCHFRRQKHSNSLLSLWLIPIAPLFACSCFVLISDSRCTEEPWRVKPRRLFASISKSRPYFDCDEEDGY
ncbi:hypothetical protein ES288_A05G324900v1 [Gossypium darwinii]|uniref:Uncharacterized protein n=1 Tax=Gossypium darwinii TaxID=34276 RepID=A0A5D2GLS7_GOSDA|nr:hypothetical protein ES288_A05G324900v1 [Gossypium darwinii]